MSQICNICKNPNRLEIDRAIIQGKPHTKIAQEYGVGAHSIRYHAQNHLSRQLSKAYQMKEMDESTDLLAGIDNLLKRTQKILDRSEEKKSDGMALKAIAESRSIYELLAKISWHLHQSKILEIEAAQKEHTINDSKLNEKAGDMLQVLDNDELRVYERLTRKIRTGNKDLKALPDKFRSGNLPTPDLQFDQESEIYEIVDLPEREPPMRRTKNNNQEPDSEYHQEQEEMENIPLDNIDNTIPSELTDDPATAERVKREIKNIPKNFGR